MTIPTKPTLAIIIILMSAFLALYLYLYKITTSPAPIMSEQHEANVYGPGYALPENAIPKESAIETAIAGKADRRKAAQESVKAAAKKGGALKTEESVAKPAVEPAPPKETGGLPIKKEVVFPTYEERRAEEARTGAVAY